MKTRLSIEEMRGVQFLSVRDAATVTGLSQSFIRDGVRRGVIPHLMAGRAIRINLPMLQQTLDAQCGANAPLWSE